MAFTIITSKVLWRIAALSVSLLYFYGRFGSSVVCLIVKKPPFGVVKCKPFNNNGHSLRLAYFYDICVCRHTHTHTRA